MKDDRLTQMTQLTYAELVELMEGSAVTWNGKYWGLQFYVTDKDWHLQAMHNNICKSLSPLKITNGDTLHANIQPDVLLIDTGVVTSDISSETGSPMNITIPVNYLFSGRYISKGSLGYTGDIIVSVYWADFLTSQNANSIQNYSASLDHMVVDPQNGYFTATYTAGESIQAILEFHRSAL